MRARNSKWLRLLTSVQQRRSSSLTLPLKRLPGCGWRLLACSAAWACCSSRWLTSRCAGWELFAGEGQGRAKTGCFVPACLLCRVSALPMNRVPCASPCPQREGEIYMAEIESVGQAYEDAQVRFHVLGLVGLV